MRILLISDSHGNNEAVDELIVKWPDVDLYLHAGDSESHPSSIYPFRVVRGNCDYSFDMQEELLIPTEFGNILVRHKKEVTQKRLEKDNIKVFIYGHTHVPECVKRKGVAFINPGSLAYPRSEYGQTYMILELSKENIDVTLYSYETHEPLKRYRVRLVEPALEDNPELKEELEDINEEMDNEETVEEVPVDDDEIEALKKQITKLDEEISEIRRKRNERRKTT